MALLAPRASCLGATARASKDGVNGGASLRKSAPSKAAGLWASHHKKAGPAMEPAKYRETNMMTASAALRALPQASKRQSFTSYHSRPAALTKKQPWSGIARGCQTRTSSPYDEPKEHTAFI
jgi:hypothetical protein